MQNSAVVVVPVLSCLLLRCANPSVLCCYNIVLLQGGNPSIHRDKFHSPNRKEGTVDDTLTAEQGSITS